MLLQKNQTLPPIICIKPTNTLKSKMTPLSPIINYKYHTNYKYANICKDLFGYNKKSRWNS